MHGWVVLRLYINLAAGSRERVYHFFACLYFPFHSCQVKEKSQTIQAGSPSLATPHLSFTSWLWPVFFINQ